MITGSIGSGLEMAKWIAEAHQDEEDSDSDEDAPQP